MPPARILVPRRAVNKAYMAHCVPSQRHDAAIQEHDERWERLADKLDKIQQDLAVAKAFIEQIEKRLP